MINCLKCYFSTSKYMKFYKKVEFLFLYDIMQRKKDGGDMSEVKRFLAKLLTKFARKVSIGNVNSVCWFYFNQPEIPEELKCLNKFQEEEE